MNEWIPANEPGSSVPPGVELRSSLAALASRALCLSARCSPSLAARLQPLLSAVAGFEAQAQRSLLSAMAPRARHEEAEARAVEGEGAQRGGSGGAQGMGGFAWRERTEGLLIDVVTRRELSAKDERRLMR